MKRRDFFKIASSLGLALSSQNLFANETEANNFFVKFFSDLFSPEEKRTIKDVKEITKKELIKEETFVFEEEVSPIDNEIVLEEKTASLDSLIKDIYIDENYLLEFQNVREKLSLVQRHIGYGNFNIISFDDMLKVAKNSSSIGKFTKKELEFFESIFYYDPSHHGFYGERTSFNITDKINKKDVIKIPRTGHYLFRGEPENTYNRMIDDVGDSLVLTSGVRSVVKQSKLFLDKINSVDNNITIASKSLAPPAYSFHTISDFDVGKKGFGHANFSSRFALTQEFFKMRKLNYIDMRYTINNKDGVRYEPWHVKII